MLIYHQDMSACRKIRCQHNWSERLNCEALKGNICLALTFRVFKETFSFLLTFLRLQSLLSIFRQVFISLARNVRHFISYQLFIFIFLSFWPLTILTFCRSCGQSTEEEGSIRWRWGLKSTFFHHSVLSSNAIFCERLTKKKASDEYKRNNGNMILKKRSRRNTKHHKWICSYHFIAALSLEHSVNAQLLFFVSCLISLLLFGSHHFQYSSKISTTFETRCFSWWNSSWNVSWIKTRRYEINQV